MRYCTTCPDCGLYVPYNEGVCPFCGSRRPGLMNQGHVQEIF